MVESQRCVSKRETIERGHVFRSAHLLMRRCRSVGTRLKRKYWFNSSTCASDHNKIQHQVEPVAESGCIDSFLTFSARIASVESTLSRSAAALPITEALVKIPIKNSNIWKMDCAVVIGSETTSPILVDIPQKNCGGTGKEDDESNAHAVMFPPPLVTYSMPVLSPEKYVLLATEYLRREPLTAGVLGIVRIVSVILVLTKGPL